MPLCWGRGEHREWKTHDTTFERNTQTYSVPPKLGEGSRVVGMHMEAD